MPGRLVLESQLARQLDRTEVGLYTIPIGSGTCFITQPDQIGASDGGKSLQAIRFLRADADLHIRERLADRLVFMQYVYWYATVE